MNRAPRLQTAHAILMLNGEYLLQLRDKNANIAAPGKWALFGGMIKDGESKEDAVAREIFEELSIRPDEFRSIGFVDYFDDFFKDQMRTWLFEADVSALWGKHKLNEGQAVKAFGISEIAGLDIPDGMREVIIDYHKRRNK